MIEIARWHGRDRCLGIALPFRLLVVFAAAALVAPHAVDTQILTNKALELTTQLSKLLATHDNLGDRNLQESIQLEMSAVIEERSAIIHDLFLKANSLHDSAAADALLDIALAVPLNVRAKLVSEAYSARILQTRDAPALPEELVQGNIDLAVYTGPPAEGSGGHVLKAEALVHPSSFPSTPWRRVTEAGPTRALRVLSNHQHLHVIGSVDNLPIVGVVINDTLIMDMIRTPALCFDSDAATTDVVCSVGSSNMLMHSREAARHIGRSAMLHAVKRSRESDAGISNTDDVEGLWMETPMTHSGERLTHPDVEKDTSDLLSLLAEVRQLVVLLQASDVFATDDASALLIEATAVMEECSHLLHELPERVSDVSDADIIGQLRSRLGSYNTLRGLAQLTSAMTQLHPVKDHSLKARRLDLTTHPVGVSTFIVVQALFQGETTGISAASISAVMNETIRLWNREARGALRTSYVYPSTCLYATGLTAAQADASPSTFSTAVQQAMANHEDVACRYNVIDYNRFMIIHSAVPSYCGLAQTPGTISWIVSSASCFGSWVIMHEAGHNFGFNHAYIRNPISDQLLEYGDVTEVMGSARIDWPGLSYSMATKDAASWIPNSDIATMIPPATRIGGVAGPSQWFTLNNPGGMLSAVSGNTITAHSWTTAASAMQEVPGASTRSLMVTLVSTEREFATGVNASSALRALSTVRVPSGSDRRTEWLYLTVRSDWGNNAVDGLQLQEMSFSYDLTSSASTASLLFSAAGRPIQVDTRPFTSEILDGDLDVGQRYVYRGSSNGAAEFALGLPTGVNTAPNATSVWRKLLIEPLDRRTHLYSGAVPNGASNAAGNTSMSVRLSWLHPSTGVRPEGRGCFPNVPNASSKNGVSEPCLGSGFSNGTGLSSAAPTAINAPVIQCGSSFNVSVSAANPTYIFRILPALGQSSTTQTALLSTCGPSTPAHTHADVAVYRGSYPIAQALYRSNISIGANDYASLFILSEPASTSTVVYHCGQLVIPLDEKEPVFVAVSLTALGLGKLNNNNLTSSVTSSIHVSTTCNAEGLTDQTGRFVRVQDAVSYINGVYQLSTKYPLFNGRRVWAIPTLFGEESTLAAGGQWFITMQPMIRPVAIGSRGAWRWSATTTTHDPTNTVDGGGGSWNLRFVCPPGLFAAASSTLASPLCMACGPFMKSDAGSVTANAAANTAGNDVCACIAGAEPDPAAPVSSTGQARGCRLCPAGTYKVTSGSGACLSCPTGTTSLPGSTSSAACRPTAPFCPKVRVEIGHSFFDGFYTIAGKSWDLPLYSRTSTLTGAATAMYIFRLSNGRWTFTDNAALSTYYNNYIVDTWGPPQTWTVAMHVGPNIPTITNVVCICEAHEVYNATERRCVANENLMPCPSGARNVTGVGCASCNAPLSATWAGEGLFAAVRSDKSCACPQGYSLQSTTDAVGTLQVCKPPESVNVTMWRNNTQGVRMPNEYLAQQTHVSGIYVRIPTLLTYTDLSASAGRRAVTTNTAAAAAFFPVYRRLHVSPNASVERPDVPRFLWYSATRGEWSLSASLPKVARVLTPAELSNPSQSNMLARQLAVYTYGSYRINYTASGEVQLLSDVEDESDLPPRFAFLATSILAPEAGALPLSSSPAANAAIAATVTTSALGNASAAVDGSIMPVAGVTTWSIYDPLSTAFMLWPMDVSSTAGTQPCCCFTGGSLCTEPLSVTQLSASASGSVEGTTVGQPSHLLNAAPEAYFAISIPASTRFFNVSLCSSATQWDSRLSVASGGCLRGGVPISSEGLIVDADNTCGSHASVSIEYPAAGVYYVLVTGGAAAGTNAFGAFTLEYSVTATSEPVGTQMPPAQAVVLPPVVCVTPIPTPSPSSTASATPSVSGTPTSSSSAGVLQATPTASGTATPSAVISPTSTASSSASQSASASPPATLSSTASNTASLSATSTATRTATATATVSATGPSTATATRTVTGTPSNSASPTVSASLSASASVDPSATRTPTNTASNTATSSATRSQTATPTNTRASALPSNAHGPRIAVVVDAHCNSCRSKTV